MSLLLFINTFVIILWHMKLGGVEMPNIKSQKKRVTTNNKRNLAAASQKTNLRTALKAVVVAIEANDKDAATKAYAVASSKLDKAVSGRICHKNYASRQKARLSKAINAIA